VTYDLANKKKIYSLDPQKSAKPQGMPKEQKKRRKPNQGVEDEDRKFASWVKGRAAKKIILHGRKGVFTFAKGGERWRSKQQVCHGGKKKKESGDCLKVSRLQKVDACLFCSEGPSLFTLARRGPRSKK